MCNQGAAAAIDYAAEQLSPPQTFSVAAPIIFANGISWPESDPLFE